MLSQEIRRNFLNYFKKNGHTIVPSSPVVPHDDPTLLFTNAGMNQFKDAFLGQDKRAYTRATTSQKCLRVGGKHNDLDNVGHTTRHCTFFEMLGNFSFGDYFKEETIQFAFEISTQVYQFPEEKIWVTIFEDDDEAFELWKKWMPERRITRMGAKDNFWAMGDTGPCGPCSELMFDRGDKYGTARSPAEDASGERYLEFWNLVFMQFNRDASGKMTPLPMQSIDTGAGLERVVSMKMGVDLVFATDIFVSLIEKIEQVSEKKYENENPAFHVISDHIRALAFAIADGAVPSNLDRGYVLRKLLRRAVRYGRGIGLEDPFLAQILPRLVEVMGTDYPELKNSQDRIAEILTAEEEAFIRTLNRGGNILSSVIDKAQKSPTKQISGEDAFKLKDTYGFPLEEVLLIAKDTALEVNLETYQLLEEKAKELSRKAHKVHSQEAEESLFKEFEEKEGDTVFVGYIKPTSPAKVVGIVTNSSLVSSIKASDEAIVLLDRTPFYAEKGGQMGDHGTLSHKGGTFIVTDCQNPYSKIVTHRGTLENGTLKVGDAVEAVVDASRRTGICNHHTATHLLHWALQQVLGPHIRQAGSLVEKERLRFDFNHHKALSPEEIRAVEDLVNDKVRGNEEVKCYELSFDEAQKCPDIKQFFGEKYGATVRVIDIDYSKELCGGTHVSSVGTLGYFRIVSEGSIAAGVRRLEAACGKPAEMFVHKEESLIEKMAGELKTQPHQISDRLSALIKENKELTAELKTLKDEMIKSLAKKLSEKVETVKGIPFLAAKVPLSQQELIQLANVLSPKHPSLALLLAMADADKCHILAKISPDLVKKGIKAGALISAIAPLVNGRGGGKDASAQAGGTDPKGIDAAFEKAKELIATHS